MDKEEMEVECMTCLGDGKRIHEGGEMTCDCDYVEFLKVKSFWDRDDSECTICSFEIQDCNGCTEVIYDLLDPEFM
jgi:hypothetical protein